MVAITVKNEKDQCRGFLATKLNKIYLEMYIDKL